MPECAPLDLVKNHAKLLAEMVPPLSSPAGGRPIIRRLVESRRIDMNATEFKNAACWPKERPKKSAHQQDNQRWLHCDYKDAPLRVTRELYRQVGVIAGGGSVP